MYVYSQFGGVSTDCDSTLGFLQAPGSGGLYPHSHAGLTESSASQPANTFNIFSTWLKVLLIMTDIM